MMVTVKVFMTLQVDDEEYAMPADGRVDEELEDAIQEMMYDIDGVRVKIGNLSNVIWYSD